MAQIELIEGIRYAVKKGESLKDAMMSFFNAGYPKEEIEEAAKIVQAEQSSSGYLYSEPVKKEEPKEPVEKQIESPEQKEKETNESEYVPSAPTVTQNVSDYLTKKPGISRSKKILLIFLFSLLSIIGILILIMVLFKDTFSA